MTPPKLLASEIHTKEAGITTMEDLQIEAEHTNEYGTFDVVVNEIDTRKELALVVLLEDTPFAEKGDSSWVPINSVETK